jgi:hypothetical protein
MATYGKTTSSRQTASVAFKQSLRQIIDNCIRTYFSGTLGREPDIVNIVMSLIYLESSFRPDAIGPAIPLSASSSARDYWNSSAIASILKSATPQQRANIEQGLRAWGLMQCMGWNVVRGASKAGGGKQEIERHRPDLAPRLTVAPGESIEAKYYGEANVENQILAGLVILESKYKAVRPSGNGFRIGRLTFSTKMPAAVAAYLGLGARDVRTGITPEQYANSICYGRAYEIANNGASPTGYVPTANPTPSQSTKGPSRTAASGHNQVTVGC